jgi:hypothetical protein
MAGRIAYYGGIVRDGLVLYLDAAKKDSYPGSGTVWRDLATNIITGSLVNGPIFSTANGGSISFDGSNDQVLIENTPAQSTGIRLGTGTTRWAVNAWVRTTVGNSSLGQSSILSNRSSGPVYSLMGIGTGGVMKYHHYDNTWLLKTGSISVTDNQWHMLSWVNLNNNTMDMYVDGAFNVNVSSSTSSQNPVDIIGASWAASFSGSIASLSIYIGSTFTSTQVLQNYNATKPRFGL